MLNFLTQKNPEKDISRLFCFNPSIILYTSQIIRVISLEI
jgi:hypothetical protein